MHTAPHGYLLQDCCIVAGTASSPSPVVYFMAQQAHGAPVGRSRSSSSTSPATTGMWDSPPRQMMQAHTAPFPSWTPHVADTFAAGAAAPAAAPSLPTEHGPDHDWNPSVGAGGYRGNFLSLLEAKDVTPEMFADDVPAAACDYLGGLGAAAAGPASACGGGLLIGTVDDPYSTVASRRGPQVKHETATATACMPSPLVYSGGMPCYDHEEKPSDDSSQRQDFGAPSTAAFLQQMVPSRVELHQSALLGCCYSGMVSERLESSFGVGSLPDAGSSFSDYNRSSADFTSGNSSSRQEQDIKPGMGMGGSSSSGSGAATRVTTRRKSEERVGGNTKKPKQEASNKTSLPKPQVPKVKLGEKITALQQIVSPFGKTDTSSVLFETIEYIKFLHEQIRLFSEPYMTKSTYKGHIRRRGEEKEEETGTGHDLRGRGLCLVPVSLTSQAYHDDTLPDCWAPAYRSCMYP